jgi:hypothetical protein
MRYYFHVVDGHDLVRDDEGIEIDESPHVQTEACKALEEMKRESPELVQTGEGWRMDVTDASGAVLSLFLSTASELACSSRR